jgi:hypothetical protein
LLQQAGLSDDVWQWFSDGTTLKLTLGGYVLTFWDLGTAEAFAGGGWVGSMDGWMDG